MERTQRHLISSLQKALDTLFLMIRLQPRFIQLLAVQ